MTTDAERWDADIAERASPAPLLQSYAWGEVQSRSGWHVERIRFSTDGPMATILTRKFGPAV